MWIQCPTPRTGREQQVQNKKNGQKRAFVVIWNNIHLIGYKTTPFIAITTYSSLKILLSEVLQIIRGKTVSESPKRQKPLEIDIPINQNLSLTEVVE